MAKKPALFAVESHAPTSKTIHAATFTAVNRQVRRGLDRHWVEERLYHPLCGYESHFGFSTVAKVVTCKICRRRFPEEVAQVDKVTGLMNERNP